MCGIIGVLRKDDLTIDHSAFSAARDTLTHRGPDDVGEFFDDSLALGHRRLSILDVSAAGRQPMITPDGRYALVFNGEIYNYEELRTRYLADVSFLSTSDTEVLLHLLARFGFAALPWLKGMFTFAFWDTKEKELFLARDPFGKKPLYYTDTNEMFLFASEIKAIAAYQGSEQLIDQAAGERYLLHEYVPSPATGFQGITQLLMGHHLRVKKGDMAITQWWKPRFAPKTTLTESQALREFDELLGQAVKRRLIADVPVGVFLSGGLDSTTIAWYMKHLGSRELHSCSIAFSEATFDESSFITEAVDQLGTIHHAAHFISSQVPELLKDMMPRMDVPLADASLLPTYAVSCLARQYMKVVLSGDGADELFGGYGTFEAARAAEQLRMLPSWIRSLLPSLAGYLPVSHAYFSFDFKVKSFVRGLSYTLARRNQIWLGSFSPAEIQQLIATPLLSESELFADVDQLSEVCQGLDSFDAVSCLTVGHYLQDDILVKLDRATMMTGLEARTPFLDIDLAEFVMKLPSAFKRDKYLLKKLMRGRIPPEIIDRPKKGFGLPLGQWMQGELKEWLLQTLLQSRVESVGWRWSYVKKLLDEHIARKADHRKKLWTLIVFLGWMEAWIEKN